MMDKEQIGAALCAFLEGAAGDIHCRCNFLYLAGILHLQAVERILVILNFAQLQIRLAITDDFVQGSHTMTLPSCANFGSEFA